MAITPIGYTGKNSSQLANDVAIATRYVFAQKIHFSGTATYTTATTDFRKMLGRDF